MAQTKYSAFFDSSIDMLAIGDLEGHILVASPSWLDTLSWSPAELAGRLFSDMVHPDDQSEARSSLAILGDGRPVRGLVIRVRHKSGGWRDLDITATLNIKDGLIYSTLRDVTQSRHLVAHHESIERVSGVGSWEIDVETGEIYWSPQIWNVYGLTPGTKIEMDRALDHYPPHSRAIVARHLDALMTRGEPYDLELEFIRADGRPIWVRSTADVEWRNGNITRAFGTFQDITARKQLEQSLEQERNRLRATLAAFPDLIFEVDSQGRFRGFHRPEHIRLFAEPSEFMGKAISSVLPPEVAQIAAQAMAEVDATGLSRGKRYALMDESTRTQHWFELSASARASDDAASGPGYLFIARDVTDSVHAEAGLRYREELLQALFASSAVGIILTDQRDGRFVDANRAFLDRVGYSLEELRELSIGSVTPPEFRAEDAVQRAVLMETGRCGPFQKNFIAKDGSQFAVLVSAVCVTDTTGQALIWGIVEDITDRVERERRLEQAERAAVAAREQLVTAVETLPDGFVLYDAEDRLVIANERYKEIYAASAPAMVTGTPFVEILRYGLSRGQYAQAIGREAEWLAERMHKHLNPGPMIEQRLGNGRVLRIFERKTPDGGSVGLRVDVTELYDARERAEEASRAKSLFLANMSHEIRTPLNGILGMAEILSSDLTDPDLAARARTIRESGETLLSILNDILDMSKIEAGKLSLEQQAFSPADVARRVAALQSLKARDKGLSFVLEISAPLPDRMGDPHRVTQILHNLLSNAVKFTESGQVMLRLSGTDGPLSIEVCDTGIGMTPEQTARIFDDFEQADASVTRRFGGTGLGVSIVRRLTSMMGGSVRIDSTPGRGTTVRVSLPLPLATGTRPDAPQVKGTQLEGLRVLVADDNPINLQIIDAFLRREGCSTTLVENGRQAVEAWAPGRFDLLCFDISMPEVDGLSALREITRLAAQTGTLPPPALAVTANAMSHHVSEYLAAGFAGHLAKPVRREALVAQIARLTEKAAP